MNYAQCNLDAVSMGAGVDCLVFARRYVSIPSPRPLKFLSSRCEKLNQACAYTFLSPS